MINTFLVTLSVKLPSTTLFATETLSPSLYPSLPFWLCFLHSTHHHWMYYLLPHLFSSLSVSLYKTVNSIKAGIFIYFVLCCISSCPDFPKEAHRKELLSGVPNFSKLLCCPSHSLLEFINISFSPAFSVIYTVNSQGERKQGRRNIWKER